MDFSDGSSVNSFSEVPRPEEEEEADELQAELNISQLSETPNNSQISDSASSLLPSKAFCNNISVGT